MTGLASIADAAAAVRAVEMAAVGQGSPLPATLDAAALTVMAARGQITGARVDRPPAFDNAISPDLAPNIRRASVALAEVVNATSNAAEVAS